MGARGKLTAAALQLLWTAVCVAGSVADASAAALASQEEQPSRLVVVVVDPTGAVVPGATVTVSGGGPAFTRSATTVSDASGVAGFHPLEPGRYAVRVELHGFLQVTPVTVTLTGQERRITVRLALARLEAQVDVSAIERQTAGSETPFSRTLTPLEIAQLPDDPVALEAVLRQMAGPDAVITVDGFRRAMLPPKSAIALITIKWGDLSAETHSHSSVVVEIVTKPGSDTFDCYGTLGVEPPALSANNPFDGTPSATTNSMSVMSSGTVWKGRTGFLAYLRAASTRDPVPVTADVPRAPLLGAAVESTSRDVSADWQVTHQFGPTAFLRLGGTSRFLRAENLGVGGLNLPERAYASDRTDHALRLSLLAGRSAKLFNHLRASARRARETWDPVSARPAVSVSGVFTGGGAQQSGEQQLGEWAVEDDLDLTWGPHAFRLGGAIERQRQDSRQFSNAQGTYTFADMAAFEDGRPLHFTYRVGDPAFTWTGTRGAVYVQDNIRLGSNFWIGAGLRWEIQSGVTGGWDLAPRVRASWTPLRHSGTRLRGGIGWYYDWIDASVFTRVLSMDGVRQYDLFLLDPDYPILSPDDAGTVLPPSRNALAPDIRLGRVRRIAFGLEQQLGQATLSLTVDDTRSGNGLRALNANAPDSTGNRPDPSSGNVTTIESMRRSSLQSVGIEARTKGPRTSLLTLRYRLRWARNDADGPFSLPADNLNPEGDWGPASSDIRHELGLFAMAPVTPRVLASVFVLASSGAPYNVTTGRDDNGDTVVNDRPPGVTRNSVRGDRTIQMDARILWRVWRGPGGPSGEQTQTTGGSQPSLSLVLAVQNVLNRTNPIGYSGVVGSPLFGKPLGALPKRQVDLGISFSF